MSKEQALQTALAAMKTPGNVFDVTIVCTTDDHQAEYWIDRLRSGLLQSNDTFPLVLAVSEDWNASSGAGNGLGTLYAFQKAAKLAQSEFGIDLMEQLAQGKLSAAMYHTAGKGTRLAPLPASENNNKPGVKLPFPLVVGDTVQPLTVLEAVVKQTSIYAKARKGRLSVFWGDQVFLPTAPFDAAPTHHIDILCTLGAEAPDAKAWVERGLDKYGVIARLQGGEAAQVEKVSHATATQMLESLGEIQQVGPSLGSFSVSAAFLTACLTEFSSELEGKTDKFDTDPHFWMPLTLPVESYVSLMHQKGVEEAESKAHFDRMAAMKSKFDLGSLGLFGAVDVGEDACWWDYGQLKLYSMNSLLLLDSSPSADLLRQFLGVTKHTMGSTTGSADIDTQSYIFGSKLGSGMVVNSLLTAVAAGHVEVDGAIVVNCAAKKITAGPGAILYNLIDDSDAGIVAEAGQVMVAVTNTDGEATLLQSRVDVDGGKAWKIKLDVNAESFEDVHARNKNADIRAIASRRQANYNKVVDALGL